MKDFKKGQKVYIEAEYVGEIIGSIFQHRVETSYGEEEFKDIDTFSEDEMREKLLVKEGESFEVWIGEDDLSELSKALIDVNALPRMDYDTCETIHSPHKVTITIPILKQKTKLEVLTELLGETATQEQLDAILGAE